jgi:hypothetical protein
MDNNQQDDITADLTEEQIWMTARSAQGDPFRAVAALAREGWRPIPQDEGDVMTLFEPRANSCHLVPSAADEKSQELAEQLRELAEILTRLGFVTLSPPAWPNRLRRAAELLVHQQAFQPVPTFPPRPSAEGEVGELVAQLREGGRSWLADQYRWAATMRRAADLLEQWSAPWDIFAPPTGDAS